MAAMRVEIASESMTGSFTELDNDSQDYVIKALTIAN